MLVDTDVLQLWFGLYLTTQILKKVPGKVQFKTKPNNGSLKKAEIFSSGCSSKRLTRVTWV